MIITYCKFVTWLNKRMKFFGILPHGRQLMWSCEGERWCSTRIVISWTFIAVLCRWTVEAVSKSVCCEVCDLVEAPKISNWWQNIYWCWGLLVAYFMHCCWHCFL